MSSAEYRLLGADGAKIHTLRNGGDLLNVFGDFPTLTDPRHSQAYSPLWDAQLGLWTQKAIDEGLNTRQIDENVVFNLAATRPDLLTGVDPATAPNNHAADAVFNDSVLAAGAALYAELALQRLAAPPPAP